jgi:hypothetical protein
MVGHRCHNNHGHDRGGRKNKKKKAETERQQASSRETQGEETKICRYPKKGKIVNSHGMKNMNFYSEKDMAKAP